MEIQRQPRSRQIEQPWYAFLAIGVGLAFVALFWLRRTGELRLW